MLYLLNGHQSNRLDFRLLHSSDFDEWLPLFTSPVVAKHLAFDPGLSPMELCQMWFDKVFDRYDNDLGGMNVLISKDTQQMIGQCGLLIQEVNGVEELEIGYSILPQYWGHGYATEAAQYCKLVAFKENFADSLISLVHEENIASKKVAIKNGMNYETSTVFRNTPVDVFRIRRDQVVI